MNKHPDRQGVEDTEPSTHHDFVAIAARRYVSAPSIAAIHAGRTWRETEWPSLIASGGQPGAAYCTDRRGVTFRHTFTGPTTHTVSWAEIADVVRRGLTEQLAHDVADAQRRYCNDRDPGAAKELSRVVRLVVDAGLTATPDQLDLFTIGA